MMRNRLRASVLAGCWAGGVVMGLACAQPPLDVQWVHDQILSDGVGLVSYASQASSAELMLIDPTCINYWQALRFDDQGIMEYPPTSYCIGQTLDPIEVVTAPSAGSHWYTFEHLGGAYLGGSPLFGNPLAYACEPLVGTTPFHIAALGVDGTVYSGRSEYPLCGSRLYRLDGAQMIWCNCIPPFSQLELFGDTVLAMSVLGSMTRVDAGTGVVLGAEVVFSGGPGLGLKTALAHDTLFWVAQFGGAQLQVGAYRLGQGASWTTTIPLPNHPVGLFADLHGRLWTAVNDRLIWLDRSTGSWNNASYGSEFKDLRGWADDLLLFGASNGASFVMHVNPTP